MKVLRIPEAIPAVSELIEHIREDRAGHTLITGVLPVHRAHIISCLLDATEKRGLILCADDLQSVQIAEQIDAFMGRKCCSVLPSRDLTFHPMEVVSREWEHRRIGALYTFLTGKSRVLVASFEAAACRTIPPRILQQNLLTLKNGAVYVLDDIVRHLVDAGYKRSSAVEGAGQFSVRGGILDLFSPQYDDPVRIEFFDNEIDSISYFSIEDQRRSAPLKEVTVLPVAEVLPSAYEGGAEKLAADLRAFASRKAGAKTPLFSQTLLADAERLEESGLFAGCDRLIRRIYPDGETAWDYLEADDLLFVNDLSAIRQSAKAFATRWADDTASLLEQGLIEPRSASFYLSYSETVSLAEAMQTVTMNTFPQGGHDLPQDRLIPLLVKQLPPYTGNLDTAVSDMTHYAELDYSVLMLASSKGRAEQLMQLLSSHGLEASLDLREAETPARGEIRIAIGQLPYGLEYPELRIALITEGQLFRQSQKHVRKKRSNREQIRSYADLSPGDIVVHENHGIARFTGIESIAVDGGMRDYIRLQFAGTDSLFLPTSALDLISKYIGASGEDHAVRLSKLGGAEWQRTRSRAKGAAKDLAKKLIDLYAERQRTPGYAFPPDDDWQMQFEENFEYEETDDQLRCSDEIKGDMQKACPMDRLLCGDVGFGKTEVAFRAIMKCVLGGKQAAMLVPTTVLARQHFLTAQHRFAGQAFTVEALSRFQSAKEIKKTLENIQNGTTDLCIGTHRLLQKDVHFKDLGLLIVDEEQRFGVTHKERLKEMSKNVDVLTLTATPIPRTLNMALSGIRDMSILEDAPKDRQPVQTYVLEHDEAFIIEAIKKELARKGQVYYLHNHIDSISRVARTIQTQIPEARIATAHGRMSHEELSAIRSRMTEGEVDILICTTIIETGLDIPNVNTLIIEDADHFGLAQLHQIRGRVGRSWRKAFAYLTFRKGKALSEIAQKRLSAIREFAEFGSGFKIAMRDLEIRGAGNVLGPEQSGHMQNIGYDLYLKLLEEAVTEEQGGEVRPRTECSTEIAADANLPSSYIPDSGQRIDLYRRIAMIRTAEDHADMLDEIIDRYGPPPSAAVNLLDIALLRQQAADAGISSISQKDGRLILTFASPDLLKISSLCGDPAFHGRILLNAGASPFVSLRIAPAETILAAAKKLVAAYAALSE